MDIIKQLCLSKINDTVFCVRWGWEWYLAIDRTFFYSSYRTTLPSVDQVMGMNVFHSLIIIFWLNWWATHKRHILNIRVHKVWCIFFFLEEKLRRGLAKSYGIFVTLSNYFSIWLHHFTSPLQSMRVPVDSHPCNSWYR